MNHQVLYRKYRPQTFKEIIGQEHVVKTLQNALVQSKIAHAYLFSGPRGSGKTTIARILAKSVNCAKYADDPCNKCANCVEFSNGRSLDLIEIDAASNRGIDEIKNLRENVRFGPTAGKYKVYLIDEAHMLTKEAFNAFLKTLEEPPTYAIFILATTEAHRLPATIISRTQRFDFRRLSVNELVQRLGTLIKKEKIKVEPEALQLIAREADGSARDAESLLGQVISTGENAITLEQTEETLGLFSHQKIKNFVDLALAKNHSEILSWLQKTIDAGHDPNQFLKSLNHYLRKLIMVGLSPQLAQNIGAGLNPTDFETLKNQAQKIKPAELVRWLKAFSEAKQNIEHYPLPQMAVEVAIINLLGSQSASSYTPQTANEKNDKPAKVELALNTEPEIQPASSKIPDLTRIDRSDSKMLDHLKTNWDKIVQEVKPFNHSLFGFLQATKPVEATNVSLTVATKYAFHKERLLELKNKKIIENAVEAVIGTKLNLKCELEK